jgi:2-oxoglutarate ferredoxin oxidoreductase subunit alpha
VVLAPQSPADCFDIALEAVRIALTSMSPVMILSDGYIANGAEPWRLPDVASLDPITVAHPAPIDDDEADFQPYERDDNLARPWAIPGTKGLEHRIGGLEKANVTGNVSYDPDNHQLMTDLRRDKVARVAQSLPPIEVQGDAAGDLLVLGWGGTFGAITTAVENARSNGMRVSAAHLRYLNPMPSNLGEVVANYRHVLVPELNTGQLRMLIRAKYLVDARGLNKVQGRPFLVEEIERAIELLVGGGWPDGVESLVPRNNEVTVPK